MHQVSRKKCLQRDTNENNYMSAHQKSIENNS